jgi:alkylation response protein AidB-like acyl-CoA dehydrogenase
MNFDLDESQEVVRDLAARIFTDHADIARIREIERSGVGIDRPLWSALADANLLGLPIAEEHGGSGLGMVEVTLVLAAQGRAVAMVPYLESVVTGVMPIAEFGSDAQRRRWLPGLLDGSMIATAALAEYGVNDPTRPTVRAVPIDGGYQLTGEKPDVHALSLAAVVLVPATLPDGAVAVFLVDPAGPGVAATPESSTSHRPVGTLRLDHAAVGADARLGGAEADGTLIVRWTVARFLVALAAQQLGVGEEAIARTAAYTSGRLQFGKPLSTFQAVAHQAADGYIFLEAMRVTTLHAAWRLAEGFATDAAETETAVLAAKFWAAEGGQKVVHLCQHLHGGMGADVDYPIHRFFLWGIENETRLGGVSPTLARLGQLIAREAS